jgi:hypothetical protein
MFFRLTINETPIICTQVNYMDTHVCNPSVMKTPMFFQNQIYEDTHVCSLKYNQEHPPYSDKHKDGCLDKKMSK